MANLDIRVKIYNTYNNKTIIINPFTLVFCLGQRSTDYVGFSSYNSREYYNDIRTVAKGFIALGLERYHSVCILGQNNPEWFISNFGAIFAG